MKKEASRSTERTFGSFYRRMQLPPGVTSEQIEANLTDGVLEVHIRVPAEPKPETKTVPVTELTQAAFRRTSRIARGALCVSDVYLVITAGNRAEHAWDVYLR